MRAVRVHKLEAPHLSYLFLTAADARSWLREVAILWDHDDVVNEAWVVDDPVEVPGSVVVTLDVENRYEHYDDVCYTITNAVISAEPAPESGDFDSHQYQSSTEQWWMTQIIYPFTGTGHTDGDSFYDVTVTDSSEPALVGRTFEWGY